MPMILLNLTTALVDDTDSLNEAISNDNGVNYVYFIANIQLARGITIHQNKTSLTIDGSYDGITYTFSDMNSTSASDTVGVRSITSMDITIKNMNIIGRNYYGFPYVVNSSSYTDIVITYDNVTYTGSQIAHNPYGLVRFKDCDILIDALTPSAVSPRQEIGEICRIEIDGTTIFRKANTSDATLRFRGTTQQLPYLKVLAGASLYTETESHFIASDYRSVPITIETGGSFYLTSRNGFCASSAERVESLTVASDASFTFIRRTSNGTDVSLYLDSHLTVQNRGSLYIRTDYANTQALVRFTQNNIGALILNDPKSFVLYGSGTATNAVVFDFAYSITFDITAGQVNRWLNATPLASGGGSFSDTATNRWHRPNWIIFNLLGTASRTGTIILDNDFSAAELEDLPDLDLLQFRTTRVFSAGNLPLVVDPVVSDQRRPIHGTTEPSALVKAEYNASGTDYTVPDVADESGSFSLVPPVPVPFAVNVYVFANTPFLIVTIPTLSREDGILAIEEAPLTIVYRVIPLNITPEPPLTPLLARENPTTPVIVSDERLDSTAWELLAEVTEPLSSSSGVPMPNAMVFRRPGGAIESLEAGPIVVYTGAPRVSDDDPLTIVSWPREYGILVHLNAPLRLGEEYQTAISWTIREAVVDP